MIRYSNGLHCQRHHPANNNNEPRTNMGTEHTGKSGQRCAWKNSSQSTTTTMTPTKKTTQSKIKSHSVDDDVEEDDNATTATATVQEKWNNIAWSKIEDEFSNRYSFEWEIYAPKKERQNTLKMRMKHCVCVCPVFHQAKYLYGIWYIESEIEI